MWYNVSVVGNHLFHRKIDGSGGVFLQENYFQGVDILPQLTQWGAGLQWRPQSISFEAPTEPVGESS